MIDPIWYIYIGWSMAAFYTAFLLASNRPILDLWIDIGLIQVSTEILCERHDFRQTRYITLRITILNKWGGSFRLYKLNHR